MNQTVTPESTMQVFEQLLGKTSVRFGDARPIEFHLDGEVWSFDPGRPAEVFAKGPVAAPALTLTCGAAVLLRMLTEPDFYLGKEDSLGFAGDPEALTPVIKALSNSESSLSIRFNR